jgi:hypothetical protein
MSISAHVCAYAVDHVEPESEIKKEQVQWIFRGPQASSYEDGNIIVIKASPDAFNLCSLSFILNRALCYSWLCIRLIGILWYRSCNRINLLIYPC